MVVKNCTATADLKTPLDLDQLLGDPNSSRHHERFSAIIYKVEKPKAKALIYASGKMILTGTKSVRQNRIACLQVRDWIRTKNIPVKLKNFKVQNMMYSKKYANKIDIAKLYQYAKPNCCYEPELFSGAHLSFDNTKAKAVVFHTGSYFITGCKSRTECIYYNKIVTKMLENCAKA